MLWKLLNRILVPERKQPQIVRWSRSTQGHHADDDGKQISQGDLILDLSKPRFESDETWVLIFVSNTGRKALGFGAAGIGLALTFGGETTVLPCKTLKTATRRNGNEDQCHQSLLIEAGTLRSHFVAVFDPGPKPERAEVVIQANRILAPPYVFMITFDLGPPPTTEQRIGTFEELLALDPTKVRSITVRPRGE
jgi:hypothetical protein